METAQSPRAAPAWRRWIIRGLVALVAIAIVVIALLPRAEPVDVVELKRGPMRVEIDGDGRTRLRDQFVVSAPISGELERVDLRVGDSVEKGAVVARLLPPARDAAQLEELRRRVDAAEHARQQADDAVRQAELALAAARRERSRLGMLVETGSVARQEIDLADDRAALAARDVAVARHRAEQAEAEVGAIRASIVAGGDGSARAVTVRAPVAGRVMRVVEASRRTVMAGTPIVVLGDPGRIEIVIDLLSTDAVRVTPGDRVRIDGWGGEGALGARVGHVEPVGVTKISALGIEEQRVDVVAALDTIAPQLGDGYRVDAHITVWESAAVLTAPTSALFRDGGAWSLFVVRDGRAARARVSVGHRTPFVTEILGGVREGEQVIPFPSDRIEEGMRVRPESALAAR
jgi:HlyD family secretion protein